MSLKTITAWVGVDDGDGSRALTKLRGALEAERLSYHSIESSAGCAVAEVSVLDRPSLLQLRALLTRAFGSDFRVTSATMEERGAFDALVKTADVAAAKVGCARVGTPLTLSDVTGTLVGARLRYEAKAVALRRAMTEAGLTVGDEQTRIQVDVWVSERRA